MRIEKNVNERRGREYSESKKNRKRQKMVQRLYETCKEAFSNCGPGVVPSAEKIERLKEVLGMPLYLFLMFNSCCVINLAKFQFPFRFYTKVRMWTKVP